MVDREKVLHGLSSCGYCDGIPNVCGVTECPYESDKPWCTHYLAHDAGELIGELLKAQEPITGETSDGYHTFNELYHHRAVLFSVIVSCYPERAWKAKKHHDGTMYDGMFIVGIETPSGQATYHYDVIPYWDMFKCREFESAPEWDGHTPAQAIERIGELAGLKAQEAGVMTPEEVVGNIVLKRDVILWFEFNGSVKELNAKDIEYNDYLCDDDIPTLYEPNLKWRDKGYLDGVIIFEYNDVFRCWTSRPDERARVETPWED